MVIDMKSRKPIHITVRRPIAPPTIIFPDRKKNKNKLICRKKIFV